MAKRVAGRQITRDNFDQSESSDEEASVIKPAAAEVLAKRPMAVPKSRKGLAGRGAAGSNPFGQLGSKPETNSSNPFGALKTTQPPAPSNPFGALKTNINSKPATETKDSASSQQLRFRALNTNFVESVFKAKNNDPIADLTHICEKYIQYAKGISTSKAASSDASAVKNASNPPPSSTAKPAVSFQLSKQTETKPPAKDDIPDIFKNPPPPPPRDGEVIKEPKISAEITSTGFKFGGNVSSATSFKFGDKQVEIAKTATSSSSKPTGGFVFNPNGTGEIKTNESKPTETKPETKPAFSFGAPTKDNSSSAAAAKPLFNFGNSDAKADTKTDTKADAKPVFSFGNSSSKSDKDAPAQGSKPAFSFGAPSASTSDESAKPKFSFGKPAESEDKPKFSFGKPAEGDDKPKFSFGKPTDNDKSEEKPKFSFNVGEPSKSPFNFGAPSGDKPVFSFGKPNTESGESKFKFGTTENKTNLSFGTGMNPFGSTTSVPKDQPSQDKTWNPSTPVVLSTQNSEKPAGESGEPSENMDEPQTDLSGPGPGEEDENNVYERRCKAYELENGKLKPLGVGNARVLVHKDTNKARLLLRAEGSGRVLLNVPIREPFKYVTNSKTVRVPDIKSGETNITYYSVLVKTAEDANEMAAKLEEVKK